MAFARTGEESRHMSNQVAAALTKIFKGFLSFHMKTPRYRLADLRLSEED